MRGRQFGGANRSGVRKMMTVLQFGMATAFVGTAAVAYDQVAHLGKKDLGFTAERILVIEGGINQWNLGLFKSELLESPRICRRNRCLQQPGAAGSGSQEMCRKRSPPAN